MKLYHGSLQVVEKPTIKKCRPHNDYGPGFYCTLSKSLACEWACKVPGRNGYCNEYDFDDAGLTVVDLDESPHGVLAWLAVLMANRVFDLEWDTDQVRQQFVSRYAPDLSDADVVCGYRADDSYFSIARAFVNGTITDQQTADALRLGDLGRQVMIASPKAFRRLKFVGLEVAPSVVWHRCWHDRDRDARLAFSGMRQPGAKAEGRRIFDFL